MSAASTSATLRPEPGGLPRPKRRPGPPPGLGQLREPSPLPGGPAAALASAGRRPSAKHLGRTTAEGRRGAAAGPERGGVQAGGRKRPHPPRPRQGGTGRALSTNPGPSPGRRGWARAAAAAGGSCRRASVLKGSGLQVTWPTLPAFPALREKSSQATEEGKARCVSSACSESLRNKGPQPGRWFP